MQLFHEYKKIIPFYKRELRRIFMIVTILFIAITAITSIYLYNNPQTTQYLLSRIKEFLLSQDLLHDDGTIRVGALIANNLRASLISIVLGYIPFLFLPFLSLYTNATIIGIVIGSAPITQVSGVFIMSSLVPHGIFEITAFLLSLASGIYLCKESCLIIQGKRAIYSVLVNGIHILRIYILVTVPLLILAGFIEVYITPLIMNAV